MLHLLEGFPDPPDRFDFPDPPFSRKENDLVDTGLAIDKIEGSFFDNPGDMGMGEILFQGSHRGKGPEHIPDGAQSQDEKFIRFHC